MITKCAVLVDGRHIDYDIVSRHLKMLEPDWNVRVINHLAPNNIDGYNQLLTSRKFWEPLEEYVLIFQQDSMILKKGINSFLGKWDFIGAHIKHMPGYLNGGLSLRSRDAMIEVIDNVPYQGGNEDIYFCEGLRLLNKRMPTKEEAHTFSVETEYILGSLGYHQPWTWMTNEEFHQIENQYK